MPSLSDEAEGLLQDVADRYMIEPDEVEPWMIEEYENELRKSYR